MFAQQCHEERWFGGSWGIDQDLTSIFLNDWRAFKKYLTPLYMEKNSDKTKVAAGLACGMLYTIRKGIKEGDVVLCPDGTGSYWIGRVKGGYIYAQGQRLPHRRSVDWLPQSIARTDMSEALRNSTGAIGTVSNISRHAPEIESLLGGEWPSEFIYSDKTNEDPSVFALEKHLEDFLVKNWPSTELGKNYDIVKRDGEIVGQQYPTDNGPIDILAIRKYQGELLVVELKRGRTSDIVVGQLQRYMGYIVDEIAEEKQNVRGCIIALEDDLRIRRALRVASNIDFYLYQISFKLNKVVGVN